MKYLTIILVVLGFFISGDAYAKDTTVVTTKDVEVCEQIPSEVCKDVTTEVCETDPITTCETIHHKGYWKKSGWVWIWVKGWSEEECITNDETTCENITETVCEPTEESVCHMEKKNTYIVHKTFTEDTRCHATKPATVTWASYDPITSTLNWSAIGGNKVELNFGWLDYQYKVMLTNDGHEKVGLGTEIGYWTNHFKMRTINDCKVGNWTYF